MFCSKHNAEMHPAKYKWEGVQGFTCDECSVDSAVKLARGGHRSFSPEMLKQLEARGIHFNVKGEMFTDEDLRNAGQDWGGNDARPATDAEVREAGERMLEKHRGALERLAAHDREK